MKNGLIVFMSPKWHLAYFVPIDGKLVDMDFKFVLPSSYINFDIQTISKLMGLIDSSFVWGLNQKSAKISMCKIHYIDSETFGQIHWKMYEE